MILGTGWHEAWDNYIEAIDRCIEFRDSLVQRLAPAGAVGEAGMGGQQK